MNEEIVINMGLAPITQDAMNRLIAKARCSDAPRKTIILRDFCGPVPDLIVDYGHLLHELIRILAKDKDSQ